jgi:hypothetical protein
MVAQTTKQAGFGFNVLLWASLVHERSCSLKLLSFFLFVQQLNRHRNNHATIFEFIMNRWSESY